MTQTGTTTDRQPTRAQRIAHAEGITNQLNGLSVSGPQLFGPRRAIYTSAGDIVFQLVSDRPESKVYLVMLPTTAADGTTLRARSMGGPGEPIEATFANASARIELRRDTNYQLAHSLSGAKVMLEEADQPASKGATA